MACNDQGSEQVIRRIILKLQHWSLRSSENHRLSKILEHEAQCRARVCQTVCAVQDHESIEQCVVLEHGLRNLGPTLCVDRATIKQLFKLEDRVPHLSSISCDWSAQTWVSSNSAGSVGDDVHSRGHGAIIEAWNSCHACVLESSCWDES